MYRFPQGKENRARHKIWETKPKRADWKPTSSTSWWKRRPLSPLDLAGRKPLPPAELSQYKRLWSEPADGFRPFRPFRVLELGTHLATYHQRHHFCQINGQNGVNGVLFGARTALFRALRTSFSIDRLVLDINFKDSHRDDHDVVTHLNRHPGKYEAYLVQRQRNQGVTTRKDETKASSSQISVATIFKPKLQPTAPESKEMTKKIATFIAWAFQPYSVVEGASFIDMIN
ncbi:hypothetical protein HPB47_015894 [Ixodes persulcatus]|uniref:Uncharacterized protein n=1 Tax=Ixodes persulcatus TaxID=34615 RepID=A0AC60QUA4_IXOPE|nr:hypothetical protein HPB47_015894 [Ixodes persulcatus]